MFSCHLLKIHILQSLAPCGSCDFLTIRQHCFDLRSSLIVFSSFPWDSPSSIFSLSIFSYLLVSIDFY